MAATGEGADLERRPSIFLASANTGSDGEHSEKQLTVTDSFKTIDVVGEESPVMTSSSTAQLDVDTTDGRMHPDVPDRWTLAANGPAPVPRGPSPTWMFGGEASTTEPAGWMRSTRFRPVKTDTGFGQGARQKQPATQNYGNSQEQVYRGEYTPAGPASMPWHRRDEQTHRTDFPAQRWPTPQRHWDSDPGEHRRNYPRNEPPFRRDSRNRSAGGTGRGSQSSGGRSDGGRDGPVLMKPRPYDGRTPWEDYQSYFEKLALLNEWSVERQRRFLLVSLIDGAQQYIDDLPDAIYLNYHELCRALADRFGVAKDDQLHWVL